MVGRRLFIGNLARDTQRSDLESTLTKALALGDSSNSNSKFHSIEIRQKNDATFAFVDVDCPNQEQIQKCMDALNESTVKGQTLKVQMAKENFMERLKKEREGLNSRPIQSQSLNSGQKQPEPGAWRREASGQGQGHGQAVPVRPYPPPRGNFQSGSAPYNQRQQQQGNYDFEIVPLKLTTTSPKKSSKFDENSDSDEDSDEEEEQEKGGIPKFRGLGFYNGLLKPPEGNTPNSNSAPPPRTNRQSERLPLMIGGATPAPGPGPLVRNDRISQRMLDIANNKPLPRPPLSQPPRPLAFQANAHAQTSTPAHAHKSTPAHAPAPQRPLVAGGLKLNPNKLAKSDKLRQESLEWRLQFQKNRSSVIHNALANSAIQESSDAHAHAHAQKPAAKKSKTEDFLFGPDDDGADAGADEDYSIKVKPQYEGKAGQKMLELNANFAWDKRFQIDERFAEESEKGQGSPSPSQSQSFPGSANASEKDAALEILGQVMGKTIDKNFNKKRNRDVDNHDQGDDDMGMTRYDPTREDHKKFEVAAAADRDPEDNEVSKKSSQPPEVTAIVTTPAEKSTFKVAANLKNLFNDSGFSLLSTFGGKTANSNSNSNEGPSDPDLDPEATDTQTRSFWNKNPFKYDSSEDEGENEDGKVKTKIKMKKSKDSTEKRRNYFKEDLFKRDSFFFRENDERLAGVFEEFLKTEEDLEEIRKKFNDTVRSELKLIARAKAKNSKRKGEKRVKILRLIRRKRRRDAKQKEKAKGDANANA